MAMIFSLLGGVIGLASAVFSLIFLDTGLALAFGIWSSVGVAVVVLGIAVTLIGSDPANGQAGRIAPRTARRPHRALPNALR